MDTSTLASGVSGIVTSMGTANTFIWGLFGDFLEMIMTNPLIAIPVLLAVLTGAISVVIRIIRRFGVKGKR